MSLSAGLLPLTITTADAYTVRPGDSVWSISSRTGEPVAMIVADNHLSNPNFIRAGQNLVLGGTPAASRPAAASGASSPGSATYKVKAGDTLWAISHRTGVPIAQLAALNHLRTGAVLHIGQVLLLAPPPPPPATPAAKPVHGQAARQLLLAAAHTANVDPALVLAVSLWESGYNQGEVSSAGAVGLMQIEPTTGAWAGPALLGGPVDLNDAAANARLGAALLAYYLRLLNNDPKLALAAYYQGLTVTQQKGVLPGSQRYVNGILALRSRGVGQL